jgi:Helicase conserved C-terminal domain
MQLFKHQQNIIDADPKKCGLFLGTGSGKGLIAIMLAKGNTLVVCPKTLRDDKTWEKQLEKSGRTDLDLTVISKEDFKRDINDYDDCHWDTFIIDECHMVCGVSPAIRYKNKKPEPKTSQIFETCLEFIKDVEPERLYLLTATPIRNPMAVYALGLLLGRDWDFYQFRQTYYVPVKMNFREIWMPKKDAQTQQRLGETIQKLGYTGKLDDWFDVPEQTHKVINVPITAQQLSKIKELPLEYPDPLVLVGKKHQVEQGVLKGDEYSPSETFPTGKLEIIEDLYEEFGKVLVFAKYTEQIHAIQSYLNSSFIKSGELCQVLILDGQTKDRGFIMSEAEKLPKCIVIAQSSVSAGYELPSFRCTVFASMSYSYVDFSQGIGRTLRANNLQKNLYVYLLSGEIDKAVYKAIENKGDFNEAIYAKVI